MKIGICAPGLGCTVAAVRVVRCGGSGGGGSGGSLGYKR